MPVLQAIDRQTVVIDGKVDHGQSIQQNLEDTFWELDRGEDLSHFDQMISADKAMAGEWLGPVGKAASFLVGDIIYDIPKFLLVGVVKNLVIDCSAHGIAGMVSRGGKTTATPAPGVSSALAPPAVTSEVPVRGGTKR